MKAPTGKLAFAYRTIAALEVERDTLAQRCRELEDYIDNHSAVTADYIARLQRTLDERDALRSEIGTLREIREIASQCSANGGYLCSRDLIELRELLKK